MNMMKIVSQYFSFISQQDLRCHLVSVYIFRCAYGKIHILFHIEGKSLTNYVLNVYTCECMRINVPFIFVQSILIIFNFDIPVHQLINMFKGNAAKLLFVVGLVLVSPH